MLASLAAGINLLCHKTCNLWVVGRVSVSSICRPELPGPADRTHDLKLGPQYHLDSCYQDSIRLLYWKKTNSEIPP